MTSPTRNPRPWPDGVQPTPEQLAAWLSVCTDEERLRFAETALLVGEEVSRCLQLDHEGRLRSRLPFWWTPWGVAP